MNKKLLILGLGIFSLTGCVEPETQKINTIVGSGKDARVVPPQNCPDWTKVDGNGGSNFGNTRSSNYGCATVTNYGVMIEDPNDMVTGKTTHRTNATRSALAVSQYESGASAGGAASSSSGAAQ